jgi:ribosomal protein S18 acetylase RimI-like enzyme
MIHSIHPLSAPFSPTDVADLVSVLHDAIEGGASVGFMLPLTPGELENYWQGIAADVRAGHRLLLVAREAGRIVGSVQLGLATKANSLHRAEVQKLLVHRRARGRGLGTALMLAAEPAARSAGRSLLVLDTSASGNALNLYARCGWQRVGVIPRYARDPDGPLIDTVVYYKELAPPA